jgi:hypothetical protein
MIAGDVPFKPPTTITVGCVLVQGFSRRAGAAI